MPLPRVTPEIGHAVKAELERAPGNQYVVSLLERLEKVNPCVAEFLSQMALRHQDPVMVSTAALLVYRLLESQAEADEMSTQFKRPG